MVEHRIDLGNVPMGSLIGRITGDGVGGVWLDLQGVEHPCIVDVQGSRVRYLAAWGSSLAPIEPGSAWVVPADGTLGRIGADGADGAAVTVADVDEVGRGPVAVPEPGDPDPAGAARVRSIAPAPDGGAWVAATATDAAVHVDRDGELEVHRDGFEPGDAPGWVAAAPDGGAWVAVPDGRAVVRLAADGTARRITTGDVMAELVVSDGGTGAWVGDVEHGTVVHLGADGTLADPIETGPIADLALGPDGAPWFVTGDHRLGRGWQGRLETFSLPAVGQVPGTMFHPVSIAAPGDGTLAFTEFFYGGEGSSAYLGRVRFDGEPAAEPGNVTPGSSMGECPLLFPSGPASGADPADDSTTTTDDAPLPPTTIDPNELTTTTGPP